CLFERDADIAFTLDLSRLVTSELSVRAGTRTRYWTNPARTAAMSWLDAAEAGAANEWRLYLDRVLVDVDVFDFADSVADLLERAVGDAIDELLGPLPAWAKDLVRA